MSTPPDSDKTSKPWHSPDFNHEALVPSNQIHHDYQRELAGFSNDVMLAELRRRGVIATVNVSDIVEGWRLRGSADDIPTSYQWKKVYEQLGWELKNRHLSGGAMPKGSKVERGRFAETGGGIEEDRKVTVSLTYVSERSK